MSKLLDYLNILDKDASAREAHHTNANAAMTKFGLNESEQSALMSGSKKQVASLMGISAADLPSLIVTPNTDGNDWSEVEFGSQIRANIFYPNYFEHTSVNCLNSSALGVRA